MFIDLSGVRSIRWSHAADRKNILGPILALPQPSAAFCEPRKLFMDTYPCRTALQIALHQPEKCSWTYPNIAPFAGHGATRKRTASITFMERGVRPCRVPDSRCKKRYQIEKQRGLGVAVFSHGIRHSAASFEQREPGATAGEAINVDSADLKNVLSAIRVVRAWCSQGLNPKNVHGVICGIRSLVALSRNPKNILGPIPVDLDSARNASELEKCSYSCPVSARQGLARTRKVFLDLW
jgi:hypothetical protein